MAVLLPLWTNKYVTAQKVLHRISAVMKWAMAQDYRTAKVRGAKTWDGIRLAFEFLVLTATRSAEVRLATWREIDLVSMVWTIPEERMKASTGFR